MANVHPDKPDIFLHYAHIVDEPDPAFANPRGWVTTLVRCPENRLTKKLGRVDSYDVWRDARLPGHVELTPDIIGRVRDAAVLWGGGEALGDVFSEVDEFAPRCRFRDCSHTSEPDYAVLAAVRDGTLPENRLHSYHKLQEELRYLESLQDELITCAACGLANAS
jgi:hypothetical protein